MNAERLYYLSSLDSSRFEPVRECKFVGQTALENGRVCAIATLNPPVNGQDFDVGADIDTVVLAPRHAGATLFPVNEFPCFVHIARPLRGGVRDLQRLTVQDVEVIGWGELYRSRSDAESRRFDEVGERIG